MPVWSTGHETPSTGRSEAEPLKILRQLIEKHEGEHIPYYVYILLCQDGSYYTGYTKHIESRIEYHKQGLGAKYTRMRKPERLVHVEEFKSHIEAMRREGEIKSLSHKQKAALVSGVERRRS